MHCANLLFSRFFSQMYLCPKKNDSREVIFNIHPFYDSLYSHTPFLIPHTAMIPLSRSRHVHNR